VKVEDRFRYVVAYTPPMGWGGMDPDLLRRMADWCLGGLLRTIENVRGASNPS
jgi:hypothetical protein